MIHIGELPFLCNACEKSFVKSQDLKRHQRIHIGGVPYLCRICDKSFKPKSWLKAHEIISRGIFMYFSVRGHAAKQGIVFKILARGQGMIFFKFAP